MFPYRKIDIGKNIHLSFSTNMQNHVPEILVLHNLIRRTRSCGTGFITQSNWFFHFHLTTLVWWKCCVPQLYQHICALICVFRLENRGVIRSGSVLQCVAVRCSALQCVAGSNSYQEKVRSGSVLQCVAVRCSALQCVAGSNSYQEKARSGRHLLETIEENTFRDSHEFTKPSSVPSCLQHKIHCLQQQHMCALLCATPHICALICSFVHATQTTLPATATHSLFSAHMRPHLFPHLSWTRPQQNPPP